MSGETVLVTGKPIMIGDHVICVSIEEDQDRHRALVHFRTLPDRQELHTVCVLIEESHVFTVGKEYQIWISEMGGQERES